MAKTEYVSGKVKWAQVHKIDKYGKYSAVLYPNEESLNKIKSWINGEPPILNELRQDDDGEYIKFGCKPEVMMGGKVLPLKVDVLDDKGAPFHQAIGNGSDVTMKLDLYPYRKGEGKAVRLRAIRIDHLIPFTPDSFPEEDRERVQDIIDQPQPNF